MKKFCALIVVLFFITSCQDSNKNLDKQFLGFKRELENNKKLLETPLFYLSNDELVLRKRLSIIKDKLSDCDLRLEVLEEKYIYGEINSKTFNLELIETRRTTVIIIKQSIDKQVRELATIKQDPHHILTASDSLRAAYDYMISLNRINKNSLGDFELFSNLIADTNMRVKLYKNLIEAGFTVNEIGSNQQFHDYFNAIFPQNKKVLSY